MRAAVARSAVAAPNGHASVRRAIYKRHEPETTTLYRIVARHLEAFLAHARQTYQRPLPKYVESELRKYLRCGILENGFSRVRCPGCHHEFLVAHSCKGRGLCPSCSARRMTATAAHMATKVFPDVPVRQWVLAVPWELRGVLAARAPVLSAVLRIFLSAVSGWYKRVAREVGVRQAAPGAVAFVQRFGGSLNLHVHYHVVMLDGVYSEDLAFHPVRAPSQLEIVHIAAETSRRVTRMLLRSGMGDGRGGQSSDAMRACMEAALAPGVFRRLDDTGNGTGPEPWEVQLDRRRRSPWSGEADGFSVHAGVHIPVGDLDGRERLLRYCARPTLSLERLSVLEDGSVAYRVKYPRKGGRTHLVLRPIEFMARIAALIPPPRHALVRYSGVLAPASKLRKRVVPAFEPGRCGRDHGAGTTVAPGCDGMQTRSEPPQGRKCDQPTILRAVGISTGNSEATACATVDDGRDRAGAVAAEGFKFRGRRSTSYIDWATLMKRSLER